MKGIDKPIMENRMKSPLVLLALLVAMAPGADAKHRAPKPAEAAGDNCRACTSDGFSDKPNQSAGKRRQAISVHRSELESGRHGCRRHESGSAQRHQTRGVAESSLKRQIAIGQRRACSRRGLGQRLDGGRSCAFNENGKRTRLE